MMAEFVECPHCGAELRQGRLACPECGSDATTGWQSAESIDYQSVELPDSDAGVELGEPVTPRWLWLVAVVTAAAFGVASLL